MYAKLLILAAAAGIATTPASAAMLKSTVSYNSSVWQETDDPNVVTYQVPIESGDLQGCVLDATETLIIFGVETWGIFELQGNVRCGDRGGFAYSTTGAWSGQGEFHGAGHIEESSGTGDFEGISGRAAELNGTSPEADDGTYDISYELLIVTEGS